MAVLTKSTEINVGAEQRLTEVLMAKPNPSKSAFERVQNAKKVLCLLVKNNAQVNRLQILGW